jgi:uncharacterized protein YjbI with pentapeptide repeats
MDLRETILSIIAFAASCLAHASDVVVTTYGAKGDGATLNSVSIQKAVDDCNKRGGGKVIFPSGQYLSGTIVLKDNVTLSLQKGAVILGSTNVEDYQNLDPFADGLGTDVGWALIVAVDAKNIGLEGDGAIDGQGAKLKAQQVITDNRPEGKRWGRRPFLLRIVRCTGVSVKGVTLFYAAAWTSHYFQSTRLCIEIDGCQDVQIKNCDINSGDDALCFKTTSSKMACSDIVVSGLRLKSGQGAIKMGTESMAAFENIKISDCYVYDTNNGGIKLLTVDGAQLRNVDISNIEMVNVKTPILCRLGSRLSVFRKGQDTRQATGTFENVVIRGVKAVAADSSQLTSPSGILISGVPGHDITGLTLENIDISLLGGGTAEQSRVAVPEAVDKYPEVKTFGPTIPAYGLWARHVNGLKLVNVRFHLKQNDLRPAFVCEDGKGITITNWDLPETNGAQAVIRLENVQGAKISEVNVRGSAQTFLRVEGKDSRNMKLSKNKTPGIAKAIEIAPEVKDLVASGN